MYYLIQIDVNSFKDELVNTASDGLQWGSAVGIALTASLLAISLIKFIFDKS